MVGTAKVSAGAGLIVTVAAGGVAIARPPDGSTDEIPLTMGYIDPKGEWAISPEQIFTAIGERPTGLNSFVDGFASIQVGPKVGFINRQGQLVVPAKFSAVRDITNGYAHVNYGGIWVDYVGGYDSSANPVIETRLESGRWGYIKLAP